MNCSSLARRMYRRRRACVRLSACLFACVYACAHSCVRACACEGLRACVRACVRLCGAPPPPPLSRSLCPSSENGPCARRKTDTDDDPFTNISKNA
eukprot:3303114-Pleurochrysis_carterae.AAC.2